MSKVSTDALVLGAGPGALAIAAALAQEGLKVEALANHDPHIPWPYTYGIWGDEVDQLGLDHLLEHRWKNTVSYFGQGSADANDKANAPTEHHCDYGLFDKIRLQSYWLNQCSNASVIWHLGTADKLSTSQRISTVTTIEGDKFQARIVIDATGYKPVFLKNRDMGPIAVQTCYGIVGRFNSPPVKTGEFILMDYRCDHLSEEEKDEPPTFLYAMDMGGGKYFLEETSLGLAPPLKLETLQKRLDLRLRNKKIEITELIHEENGLYLPMNLSLPDLNQPILGFGGSAAMVHPASGYMVGSLLRRAPILAKAVAEKIKDKNASPAIIAKSGWKVLWPKELRRKQALYQFGLEKLMRFKDPQLRAFFQGFFDLPTDQWYGFLTNTLSLEELVKAMWDMFKKAPWSVRIGLMGMQGRELKLLWDFLKPLR